MVTLREHIQENLPFISVLLYGEAEYVGLIANQDQYVTSFYDLEMISDPSEKAAFLELGERWWWESNRQIPINIFLKKELEPFRFCLKTFNSKDVKVTLGPVVNISNLAVKRVKRKNVQLVRSPKSPD